SFRSCSSARPPSVRTTSSSGPMSRARSRRRCAVRELAILFVAACGGVAGNAPPGTVVTPAQAPIKRASGSTADQAKQFLAFYNGVVTGMTAQVQDAEWKSATDVSDTHSGERMGAESVMAGFTGSAYVIQRTKELLAHANELDDLQQREL